MHQTAAHILDIADEPVNAERMNDPVPDSVRAFERAFAGSVGASHAISFSHGRTALKCVLDAQGLEPGDEVILSPLTCKVVPLSLLSLGLRPVYADISPNTLNLDAAAVRRAVTPATRAVVFQRTYGSSVGIEAVAAAAREAGLFLVEDCAQATPYDLRLEGDAAIFSNNLRKPLPAGSGGMLVTNDDELAASVAARQAALRPIQRTEAVSLCGSMAAHGLLMRPRLYWPLYELVQKFGSVHRPGSREEEIEREVDGVSARIGHLQASAGLRWIERLPRITGHRRGLCDYYGSAVPVGRRLSVPETKPGEPLYFFPVLVEGKESLLQAARSALLEVVSWPGETSIYPVRDPNELRKYGYAPGHCPAAEHVAARLVGLPTDVRTTTRLGRMVVELLQKHNGQ